MPASQDKRVLVTGGTGFIGRHAIGPLLDLGFEVHLATRSGRWPRSAPLGGEAHAADLLRADDVQALLDRVAPSYLLHFAWYAEHGKYWASDLNLNWVQASLELLKGFVARGGRRAVFAGTCAEYDWSFGYCSEGVTPTRPRTLYGTCKNALREIATQYAQQVRLEFASELVELDAAPVTPALINRLLIERSPQSVNTARTSEIFSTRKTWDEPSPTCRPARFPARSISPRAFPSRWERSPKRCPGSSTESHG